jgi:carbonic anhydrase
MPGGPSRSERAARVLHPGGAMRLRPPIAAVVPLAVFVASCASRHSAPPAAHGAVEHAPHWDYGPDHGPAHWSSLDPANATCASGTRQSPIDIVPGDVARAAAAGVTELRAVHRDHAADVVHNGHTVQVNDPGAETLTIAGQPYTLVQYHFHSPSENTVAGRRFPLEMHLVHRSSGGALAVLGVLVEEGAENPAFAPLWSRLPRQAGEEIHLEHVSVDVDAMLPRERAAWRFDGSLTTPPCTEGVTWLVFARPVALSARQIAAFRGVMDGNSRPVQPRNGRALASVAVAAAR